MRQQIPLNIPMAIIIFAAVTAVALRARRPEPRRAPGAEPAPITVRTPGSPGRPASAAEQAQDIFHELHADGRNAACAVCDSQHLSA